MAEGRREIVSEGGGDLNEKGTLWDHSYILGLDLGADYMCADMCHTIMLYN